MTGHPTLRRKLRRDIRRQWPQFTAVAVAVLLGVALFAASYDAYGNLKASYAQVFAQQRFADVWVTGPAAASVADTVRTSPDVAVVAERTQADLALQIGADKLRGRAVGIPLGRQPAVDRLTILSGHYPRSVDEVAVEHHVADHFGLQPGGQVRLRDGDGWRTVRVAAVVSSAEYLWPARSRQEPMTTPEDFGVVFAPQPLVDALVPDAPHQTLVRLSEAAGPAALDRVVATARGLGAADITTRAEQPSNSLLQEDINGFSQLSYLFPLLFLTAAGMATYVLLTRRVDAERDVIGMLLASGVRRRSILGHYLSFGIAAALTGAVVGVTAGELLAGVLTHYYLHAIDLPSAAAVIAHGRVDTVVTGLAFGLVAGVLATLAPALTAARQDPAAAMRGMTPASHARRSLLETLVPPLRRAPARVRMVLRGVGRNRRRTTFTAVGVVLSLLVILTSWTMIDTMTALVDVQFNQVTRQDARVDLAGPADAAALDRLRATPGVAEVEPQLQAPVALVHGDASYATALVGLPSNTALHGFRLVDGTERSLASLPAGGVFAGQALRDVLHVHVGDTITLLTAAGIPHEVTVAGLLDEPLGTFLYAPLPAAQRLTGAAPTSALLRYAPGAARDSVRRAVTALPGVTAYEDAQALKVMVDQYAGLFYGFVGAMLVLGGVMAFAIIFTTMSVNIVERSREVATLRTGGVRRRTIAGLISAENLLVTVLGIVPGLLIGVLGGGAFLSAYNTDQFHLTLVVRPLTLAIAAAAIIAVAALSQWPGLRAVSRLDLGQAVRERAS